MKLSCLNSRKYNLCQKLSDWSQPSLKQGYQSLFHPCLQHGSSYLQLAVLQQWSHVSWNSSFLFAHLLLFRISVVSANPGKVLFCLYNWAISRSWAGMEAAVLSEHSRGLIWILFLPLQWTLKISPSVLNFPLSARSPLVCWSLLYYLWISLLSSIYFTCIHTCHTYNNQRLTLPCHVF